MSGRTAALGVGCAIFVGRASCSSGMFLFLFGRAALTVLAIAGNNYSITNESRTKNARIFFAQGCEVEPEMASQ